ncbi:MAG TPA: MFS transporter [Candidatus Dormibacteraeota bacterium]
MSRALILVLFFAIEALDEFVFGAREAAWPLIRHDLGLTYAEIGLVLGVPGVLAALVEPGLFLFGDAGRRRLIVVAGGLAFALAIAVTAMAPGFAWLLLAMVVMYPASGAFVALSQASLMDLDVERHEVNMARWTLAGSVGAVFGPLALTLAIAWSFGWRGVFGLCAAATLPLVLAARAAGQGEAAHSTFSAALAGALAALRRREVWRWLLALEATDLMGDVLAGFLALYFVDVARVSPVAAGGALVVWTVAGLAGDALLLLILRRLDGARWLRWSGWLVLAAYPALLLVPNPLLKLALLATIGLLRAGWYSIPQARLYSELPGAAGTAAALTSLAGAAGYLAPLGLGLLAERVGLQPALWALVAAPLALLALAKRSMSPVENK